VRVAVSVLPACPNQRGELPVAFGGCRFILAAPVLIALLGMSCNWRPSRADVVSFDFAPLWTVLIKQSES
jgi:hypothetical protein